MAGEWKEATLGDFIEIEHGYAFQGKYFRDEPPGDILLTPGNFAIGGGFKSSKFKYYSGPVPERFLLNEGDLLVTMTDLSKGTDTLGFPALVPGQTNDRRFLHNQRLGKVTIRPGAKIEKHFLYYLLCGRDYRNEIIASATGTTVKHTSPTRIKNYKFLLPPEDQQRAIAKILTTLDDKVKVNQALNKTLEAIARGIYKSWFVDFEPVRAKASGSGPDLAKDLAELFPDSFQESAIGAFPRGWHLEPLPKVIDINPPRTLGRGEIAPYLDMTNMPTQGHSPDLVIERAFSSGTRFINGDTLVARITPCLENGKTAYVDFLRDGQVGWGSTEFIVLRPKSPLPTEFAYCLARSKEFRESAIQSMTGSSGRQRVAIDSLSHFMVPSPSREVAALFGRMVGPLFARARAAADEAHVLISMRDSLLPELLSGEVSPSDTGRILGGHS